ncbi:MAG: tRNA uridine-5-carboxymethylaminomethyl(34) synthesis enzyme MnmG [Candidatus Omnitrophica bacterium]|nr:tRNA uridine-5-carboxymethylaminomethyl(34) synthesis enzyme MnmG [Candidatus Omnitrophota bacterium]MCM8777838.1 tRNA uridine-5-carboxymethylaminomethyl(34) synthesis enzyme MnmG [Candidatus Omnitrophota bacterium]
MKNYDIIVVGGGHSGIEASLAGARMGLSVLLITFTSDKIGYMSCNPAVGGVGKGQLVKEIDALGGEMAKATDSTGIQFRVLNSSKGPAVWSSRVQVDRKRYALYIQEVIKRERNIEIIEGEVTDFLVEDNKVKGVELDGEIISGKSVILAPGTFLNGTIYIGMEIISGGRIEETKASQKLSDCLRRHGFEMLRFKTGTCARLDGKTINFNKLKPQYGDEPPTPFSFSTEKIEVQQVPCYITYTNEETHRIIKENLNRSPLFTGMITGTGVRYCPSLEDKIVKFPHHTKHHIFLEPEGLDTDTYYPNGISTSLPVDVQERFIHTIEGLEDVKIERYGYGIEHDVVEPRQLYPTLETKKIEGLFLAGQINGTTGYEEAAAQGLIAGINASLKVKDQPPFILDRASAYIGVLIDDLTTKGTNEPYRMFTSRVEYRMILREDNADLRLRENGYKLGLVSRDEWEKTLHKKGKIEELIQRLKREKITVEDGKITLFEYLIKPGISIKSLIPVNEYPEDVMKEAEIEIKYSPYVKQMLSEIKEFRNLERIRIPEDIDYNKIPGLSLEIREKLSSFKPLTLGQASRISGITPAAVSVLFVHLKKFS